MSEGLVHQQWKKSHRTFSHCADGARQARAQSALHHRCQWFTRADPGELVSSTPVFYYDSEQGRLVQEKHIGSGLFEDKNGLSRTKFANLPSLIKQNANKGRSDESKGMTHIGIAADPTNAPDTADGDKVYRKKSRKKEAIIWIDLKETHASG